MQLNERDREYLFERFRAFQNQEYRSMVPVWGWQRLVDRFKKENKFTDFAVLVLTSELGMEFVFTHPMINFNDLFEAFSKVATTVQAITLVRLFDEFSPGEGTDEDFRDYLTWLWAEELPKPKEVVHSDDVIVIFRNLYSTSGDWLDEMDKIRAGLVRQLEHGETDAIPALALDDDTLVNVGAIDHAASFCPDLEGLKIVQRYRELVRVPG